MAKKDTLKALINRDISEESAEKLLTKYSTLQSIASADPKEIVELGIDETEAMEIISKIGKKSASKPSTSSVKKAKKEVEEEVIEPLEPVYKRRQISEFEQKLIDRCAERNADIPLKIIVGIASRIEGKDVPDEKIDELIDVAARMYESHRMDYNESVGIMAAQSIGEPGTQMNMRMFVYLFDQLYFLMFSVIFNNFLMYCCCCY